MKHTPHLTRISGWGRVPVVQAHEVLSEDLLEATEDVRLSRGLGRSYGDASLPPAAGDRVAATRLADRILAFDRETGVLRAEAGTSLLALNSLLWPAGYAVPVVPGTQLVTLGGMVASDVHGKNQHVAGDFGDHVRSVLLRVADGRVLRIGPDHESELFQATVGGMGLTGHVLEVELALERIPSAWVYEESQSYASLDTLLDALRDASPRWPFTVCWVDGLSRGAAMGRGILYAARWADASEAPARVPAPRVGPPVPFTLPSFVLGSFSVRAFNALWYRLGAGTRKHVVHPQRFFAPLDGIGSWNRAYGPRGPIQYQCVFPTSAPRGTIHRFFDTLTRMGGGSFLCVIKDCGRPGIGMLSFPMPGVSVALDLAMRDGATQRLVDALNEIVLEAGGRIYLTKDALTRPEHFRAMERGRLERFLEVRRKWDPETRIRSAQSVRLMGDEP